MLEELEERCVLSTDTTVASINPAEPTLGLADAMTASLPKNDPSVVFLGDSITWGFAYGSGAPIWAAFLAPLGAVDYGIPGQTTQSLLYQLSLGQLNGIQPSMVVLTIGTNNLLEGDSPQTTAAGIVADVQAIHSSLPRTQVLVLGVPPGGQGPFNPYRLEVNETGALVSQSLNGDPSATFMDIAPTFEQPDGSISPAVMADSIHPTQQGYIDWAAFLMAPLAQVSLAKLASAPHPSVGTLSSLGVPRDFSLTMPGDLHSTIAPLPTTTATTAPPLSPPSDTTPPLAQPGALPPTMLQDSGDSIAPVFPTSSTNTAPPSAPPPGTLPGVVGSAAIPPVALDHFEEIHALVMSLVRASTWMSSTPTTI
jgi:lysophospholipase L1-like esterase